MGKNKTVSISSNIKKSNGESKTYKPIKKYESSDKKTKKSYSGSKTENPLKTIKNKDKIGESLDINKIFDIIDSETKRNENNLKKKEIYDVIESDDDTFRVMSTKSSTKKPIVNVSDTIEETSENNPHNIDKISKMVISSYLEAKKFLKDHNISISTITLNCKLHTLIDVDKFAKNVVFKEVIL